MIILYFTHLIWAAVLDDLCAEVATSDCSQILHKKKSVPIFVIIHVLVLNI